MAIDLVLLDLDGVVRHFDPAHVAAFEPSLLDLAITGRIPRSEWTKRVGEAVDKPAAAAEWTTYRGNVDPPCSTWSASYDATAPRLRS